MDLSFCWINKKGRMPKLKARLNLFFKNFYEGTCRTIGSEENIQFSLTTEKLHLLKNHEKFADSTKDTLEMVIPLKLNYHQFLKKFDYVPRASSRGIKVRAIVHEAEKEKIVL